MGTKNNVPAKVDETQTLPVLGRAYEDFAGEGYDNQTQDDIAIPFINILQGLSPEVQDDGVDGAKPGRLIDSVTQELFDEIEFTPALSKHVFVEWMPRDKGGGIVAQHHPKSQLVKDADEASTQFGKYSTPDGNDLVETFYLFGVVSVDGNPRGMAVMAFTSTKIKSYKAAMTRLRTFQIVMEDGRRVTPPMYAHRLLVSTKRQKNSKGTFYVPSLVPAVENDVSQSLLPKDDIRFQMAKECYDLVKTGRAEADTDGQKASADDPSEDMPF